LLIGDGAVGAALTAHAGVARRDVHRLDRRRPAHRSARSPKRSAADGAPIALIAETGGQNALIVDSSSALPEQVVADVLGSAFDSAGQRCSALRVLCLQDDIAERTLAMLKAAMRELDVGPPDRLSTDVGPVISAEALATASTPMSRRCASAAFGSRADRSARMRARLFHRADADRDQRRSPISNAKCSGRCCMCCVIKREALSALIDALNATGYALTGGVHSRIDDDDRSGRFGASPPATSTSTATSSAPWSACSLSAAMACRAPGRRRAARSI
jgi:RHH-type proline utilization regulon transcriptional repressor/proline dehydrogenase/delta 1-pyrroline-5-carboxylate dehydrogenase